MNADNNALGHTQNLVSSFEATFSGSKLEDTRLIAKQTPNSVVGDIPHRSDFVNRVMAFESAHGQDEVVGRQRRP
jgi:hypothetical protein